jgi:FtsZ-interacting cell division protein YlmF
MKEKLRGFLGFLGLIEDEYGEYGSTGPARPFSDQPVLNDEPEWSAPPVSQSRQFPTSPSGPASMRAQSPQPPRTSSISVLDGGGQVPRVRAMAGPGITRGVPSFAHERDVAVFIPRSYNESRRITDLLRANRPVVLNVSEIDPSLARRLVDFAAGTAYALSAKIEILDSGVYLVCPQGVHLGPDERDRLRATNYRELGNA